MKKIIFVFVALLFGSILLLQVKSVLAHHGDEDKPISSPISSPVTSPMNCKPGWGFGDKNHCHIHKDNHGSQNNDDQGQDKDNGNHDNGNNKRLFISPLGHDHE